MVSVIITDAMLHWPAMSDRPWSDLQYLKVCCYFILNTFISLHFPSTHSVQKCAGYRTVPIEVGKHYLEDGWSQKLLTLNEFIDQFVSNEHAPQTGYLAQTQLFEQIPELRKGAHSNEFTFFFPTQLPLQTLALQFTVG